MPGKTTLPKAQTIITEKRVPLLARVGFPRFISSVCARAVESLISNGGRATGTS